VTDAELLLIVRRCLSFGVPSGVVGDVFGLDRDYVERIRRELLVGEYGTADQAEYLEWLQWRALDRCQWIVDHGSPADVTKVATAVLSRQLVTQGKRTSDAQRQAMERISGRLADMREGVGKRTDTTTPFVVAGAREDGEDE
jgi:hypothetical protein